MTYGDFPSTDMDEPLHAHEVAWGTEASAPDLTVTFTEPEPAPAPGARTEPNAEPGALVPDPPYDYPFYVATSLRAPKNPLWALPDGLTESHGPVFNPALLGPKDNDLTHWRSAEPLGERIVISGRVTNSAGRPVRQQLVEIWQANASGRYHHDLDRHDAPLDPNFHGAGRCLTDDNGRYQFVTIKPGAYPWKNHRNSWRPAHVHFSVFGRSFMERLVTQMYFPGDPLLELDPIYRSIRDPLAARSLVAKFDIGSTVEDWALGYVFDIVVGSRPPATATAATAATAAAAAAAATAATPAAAQPGTLALDDVAPAGGEDATPPPASVPGLNLYRGSPSQTAGHYMSLGTEWAIQQQLAEEGTPGAITLSGRILDGAGHPVSAALIEWWQASPDGRFPPETGPSWSGFTRTLTGSQGQFRLVTLKPGPVPTTAGQLQAPHINVSIFAPGLLQRLVTRVYFSDEGRANLTDPLLSSLEAPSLRSRLVAGRTGEEATYRLDFHLQGAQGSVFFAPW